MTDDNHLPLFLRATATQPAPATAARNGNGVPPSSAYAARALEDELRTLAHTTKPGRNVQLNNAAFNLAQLVAAGSLDRDTTWDALYDTAIGIGLTPRETTNTLRSAFAAGGLHPRRITNLDLPVAPPVTVLHVNGNHAAPPEDDEPPPSLRDRFPALDWHELWADDTKDEWVIEPLLPARRLVALYSAPKVGKSLLLLELAVAVARGEPILGYTPDRPRRVLYVDFENDPRGDIRTRLQAMGQTPDQLGDLVYLSYPRLAYLDTLAGGAELLALVEEYDCEVIVIDTISRAVGGEENENDTWLGFYKYTGLALKASGRTVIRLDHTGKDPTKGMRGGSAKYGDVDAVWSMTVLTEDAIRLECTANRLPITEKSIVVRRKLDPLRHVVDTAGVAGVLRDEEGELIDAMDRLGLPVADDWGLGRCGDALTQAGIEWRERALRSANKRRKERGPLLIPLGVPVQAPVQAEEDS